MEKAINIKGAIFDLDGTLLNSMDYWRKALGEFVASKGYTPPSDTEEKYMSNGIAFCHAEWVEKLGFPYDYETTLKGVYDIMEKHYATDVFVKDGVFEMLDALKARGVKMCLATATDHHVVDALTVRLGIDKYFDKIFTCSDVGKGKRYPLIYERALEFLGTPKENTYVFEDAYYALTTAHTNGFKTVGIYDRNVLESPEKVKEMCDFYTADYKLIFED